MRNTVSSLCVAASIGIFAGASHAQTDHWRCLGGGEGRTCFRSTPVPSLASPRWVLSHTAQGEPIQFVGPSGPVAAHVPQVTVIPTPRRLSFSRFGPLFPANPDGEPVHEVNTTSPRLYVTATIAQQSRALSIDARTGAIVWNQPIPPFIFDTWASPAINTESGIVVFASGSQLTALRLTDGVELWHTPLAAPAVNASPLITSDLGACNRAFITDYGGFGGPSSLYCINVSPYNPTMNPFAPGEVVWAASIGSATGATPAYHDGVVYVTSTGLDTLGYGEIRAFNATATEEPPPLWTFTNPIQEGFFGGLTVQSSGDGQFVYAATYAFYGGMDSANMVKVNARTGKLVWSTPCNRTDSIPVVLPDRRVALSTGIQGFGTVPSLQMFQDHGASATLLWDTALSTWNDANKNGFLDLGEFLLVGGWTTHPVLSITPRATRLLIGSIPTDEASFGPYTRLFELDLNRSPEDAGFIVQQTNQAGSTPAVIGSGIYSIGRSGLAAFGPPPP